MNLLVVTFVVMLGQCRGYIVDNMGEFRESARGVPGTSSPGSNKCKKDILLVVDMSSSIGGHAFYSNVKPFLENLAKDPTLNVDFESGSQIALLYFSSADKTDVLFNFGAHKNKTSVEEAIKSGLLSSLFGDYTRTAIALKKANTLVFPNNSPNNYRHGVQDVILILTDGSPRNGIGTNETKEALIEADKLKKKNIKIVALAIGKDKDNLRPRMIRSLQGIASSPDLVFKADKNDLAPVMQKIVDASCKPIRPADCGCVNVGSRDRYISPNQKTVQIKWSEPTLQCQKTVNQGAINGLTKTVTPSYNSPHNFGPGKHIITYSFVFPNGGLIDCYFNVTVKSCQCTNVAPVVVYTDTNKGLASWTVPKTNCGATKLSVSPNVVSPHLFAVGQHTVSYKYSVGSITFNCDVDIDVKACQCTNVAPVVVYTDTNKGLALWTIPKTNCGATKLSVSPNVVSPHLFAVGQHTVSYKYSVGKTNFNCDVKIDVKACQCANVAPVVVYTDTNKGLASWTIPKSNCGATKLSVSPNVVSPHHFAVGQHTVSYKYSVGNINFNCDVDIDVKACQCTNVAPVVVYTDTNKGLASWTIPKTNCGATKLSVSPNVVSPHLFAVGQHTVSYKYSVGNTNFNCDVDIDVKACRCDIPTTNKVVYVKPDLPRRKVSWKVPKPTCSGMTLVSVAPNIVSGSTLDIGQHNIIYKYSVGSVTLTCDVNIAVKVVPCQGKDYDVKSKVCCCGQLHKKTPNYACCGSGYHDKTKSKCCSLYDNIVGPNDTCPGDIKF